MRIRATRIIIPLILLALALSLSSNLLLRLFILSVGFLFISYLWALLGARGVWARFGELPERCQVGDRFNETISVFNHSRLPGLLLKFEEDTNIPGCSNVRELNLRPKSSFDWQTTVYCQHRGRFRLGSGTITAGDPFGLFSRNYKFGQPRSLLVYPATVELPFFEVSTSGVLGDASSGWLIGQTGTNASGVREFINGDSLMHIHWPSTARSGRLMVKMFDGGRAASTAENVYIVVDMNQSVHQGKFEESSVEYAVTIAASLVKKYIDGGLRVGLIVAGSPILSFIPEAGEEHYHRVMEALALVQADGAIPVEQIITDRMKSITSDSVVVVITPTTSPLIADAIRQLRNRDVLVSVISIDPESFGGVTGSSDFARHLRRFGIQVYTVRKGDDLCKELDQRTMPLTVQYI